jgi:hypothetical protein
MPRFLNRNVPSTIALHLIHGIFFCYFFLSLLEKLDPVDKSHYPINDGAHYVCIVCCKVHSRDCWCLCLLLTQSWSEFTTTLCVMQSIIVCCFIFSPRKSFLGCRFTDMAHLLKTVTLQAHAQRHQHITSIVASFDYIRVADTIDSQMLEDWHHWQITVNVASDNQSAVNTVTNTLFSHR